MIERRTFIKSATAAAMLGVLPVTATAIAAPSPGTRIIPSSGDAIPCVGLGSWITFNVGDDPVLLDECARVIGAFLAGGGRMIDSSPMYGSSQATIGHGLAAAGNDAGNAFSADKVWTSDGGSGAAQIETSRQAWRIPRFDLMQVHNLVAWQDHLETLFAMKADGRLRYVGVTTSHGRRHDDLEQIMATHPLDFVQLTYNAVDREVENRLLPLAQERGIAVIVNRPYQRGRLVEAMQRHPLPAWAEAEAGSTSWAQLLLRFTVSHPAVTCAIPATTKVEHVRENLAAGAGDPLDAATRQKLADHIQSL
jgi:diketogulonate reductase-like aldo/keto reductase